MAEVETRKRRPRLHWLVGILALLTTVAIVGVIGLLVAFDHYSEAENDVATEEDIITDEAQLAITTARLDEVGNAMNELPNYASGAVEPAQQAGCAVDSGDLFQPNIYREWAVDAGTAEQIVRNLRRDLTRAGFEVADSGPHAVDNRVRLEAERWAATGWLFKVPERHVVQLDMTIEGDKPCSLRGFDPDAF